MNGRNRLTTVSFIALATASAMGQARANDVYNVFIDWSAETLAITAGSSSAANGNNQNNENTTPSAEADLDVIETPVSGSNDVNNGVVPIVVDDNSISALAVLNTSVDYDDDPPTPADPMHLDPIAWNTIDMWTATGSGSSSAATLASLQSNDDGSALKSKVTNSDIRSAVIDLGAGSSQDVTNNTVLSQAIGNEAINTITGDINPLFSSTEGGFTGISGGPTLGNSSTGNAVGASAGVLVASVQENSLAASTSTIDNVRIGLLAEAVDNASISKVGFDVSGNDMVATITGNKATNVVDLDDALDANHVSATTLTGSAGVANAQRNTIVGRTYVVTVSESEIEVGQTGGKGMDNLVQSDIDFTGNTIAALGSANTAGNMVRLGEGISQDGTFPIGGNIKATRSSTVLIAGDGTDGNANVIGDLFVASHQFTQLDITGQVGGAAGDADDGDLNVWTESLDASTIDASANAIVARVTGNTATNLIATEGGGTLDSLVSLGNAQMAGDGSSSTAMVKGDLTVSAATAGGVIGDIADSTINVDGNGITAAATGNTAFNQIDLAGGTITGAGVDPTGNFVQATHVGLDYRVAADFGMVSGQFTSEAEYVSSVTSSIDVKLANIFDSGSTLIDSKVSVSGNTVSANSTANRITGNTLAIGEDGKTTSFAGTVGVISAQVAQGSDTAATNHLTMSATLNTPDDVANTAIIDVESTAATIDGTKINVDGNIISATVTANLVDAGANALSIAAGTVSDAVPSPTNQSSTPIATVYRSLTDAVIPNAAPDGLPDSSIQGGFVIVNEQSVEDIIADGKGNTPLQSHITPDAISVSIGVEATNKSTTNTDISVTGNKVTSSVTGNKGDTSLSIEAQSLDGTSTLVNTQTFWNEQGGVSSFSGGIDADMNGAIGVLAAGTTAVDDLTVHADKNVLTARGQINDAVNDVSVTAGIQTVVDVVTGNDVNSVEMGYASPTGFSAGNTLLRSETGLLNSQEFGALSITGVDVDITSGVYMTVDVGGVAPLTNSKASMDLNAMAAQAKGNDAANTLTLDVGGFDLKDAGATTATNGPLAIIANHQRGSEDDAGTGSLTANITDSRIEMNASGIQGAISNSTLSADGNRAESLARVNYAGNVLDVSGTSYEEAVAATPSVEILDVAANTELTVDDLAFGIASYQLNAVDASATVSKVLVSVSAEFTPSVSASTLSTDDNDLIAEVRGNEVVNEATIAFGTDHNMSGFIANLQQTDDGGATLTSTVFASSTYTRTFAFGILTDGGTFSVERNEFMALASANRAENSLTATGNNLLSGTRLALPSAVVNPAAASDVTVAADISIVNVQGAEDVLSTQNDTVTAIVDSNLPGAAITKVGNGRVAVDNNVVLGSATIHSAFNSGLLDAKTNVGTAGDTASAAVVSRQIVTSGSNATASVTDNGFGLQAPDISTSGVAGLTVDGNKATSSARGGFAVNDLTVRAGATITGGTPAAAPTITNAAQTLNADFSVLNVQVGDTDVNAFAYNNTADITTSNGALNDSMSLSGNEMRASATGFLAVNGLTLESKGSSDATGQVGNRQAIVAGSFISSAASARVRAMVTGGVQNTLAKVNGNTLSSSATGNVAFNDLSSGAESTMQQSSGAGASADPTAGLAITGADYGVLNSQSVTDTQINSTVATGLIAVDGVTSANGSAISVDGNTVVAEARGNQSVNTLTLNSGTFAHPSAAVTSMQTNSGATISARTEDVRIGIGETGNLNGASTGSSLSVSGNTIGAVAVGNSSVNIIRAE